MKKCWKQLTHYGLVDDQRAWQLSKQQAWAKRHTVLPYWLKHRQNNVATIIHKQLVQINILRIILFSLPLPLSTLKKQPGLLAEAPEHSRI